SVGRRRHLPGDRGSAGPVSDDLPRRACETQKSACAVDSAGCDRLLSRQALSSSPETAPRLPQEAEPRGAVVGDRRPLRVLAVASLAPGIGLRVAGTQRVAGEGVRPVQTNEAQPGAGRRAGVFPAGMNHRVTENTEKKKGKT